MNLQSLILSAEEVFHIKICVHDVSGITYADRELMLDYDQKSHSGAYCLQVKNLMGKHACMQQKLIAMRYLRFMYKDGMYGICSMGLCEYVLPVVINNHLLAVLFIGGAVREDREKAREKLTRKLVQRGYGEKHPFLEEFDRFYTDNGVSRSTLFFFARLVGDMLIEHSSCLTGRHSRSYSESTWRQITPTRELPSSWVVQSVVPYIQENFRTPLSLRHLCDLFFITPQYLCRSFSKEMHSSPMAYVNYLRIETAAREIAATSRSLADIGADMGINDPNYFYRLFKKKMGMTPKEFRKRSQHAAEKKDAEETR